MRIPREDNADRRQEIVNTCLDEFLKTGLFETSARDLGRALHMHPGGLYYYFDNKDALVVACAEEAALRLEDALIRPMLELGDPDVQAEEARHRLEALAPTMRFFAQVCTTRRYFTDIEPILARMKRRHLHYAEQFAAQLGCATEEIAPYLYACVATVANYMIFGEELYFDQPTLLLKQAFRSLRSEQEA